MKIRRHIHAAAATLLGAAAFGAFTSCITDEQFGPGGEPDGVPVVLSITAGAGSPSAQTATRAAETRVTETHEGSGIDSDIASLRVLGFRIADGTLAFNETVERVSAANDPTYEGTFTGLTGRYDLVFIANEGTVGTYDEHGTRSNDATGGKLIFDLLDPAVTLDKLRGYAFGEGAFKRDKAIPMTSFVKDVKITSTSKEGDPRPGITNGQESLIVKMMRLGVRLDLTLTLSDAQFAAWHRKNSSDISTLTFVGVPDRAYLFQRDNTVAPATPIDRDEYYRDAEGNAVADDRVAYVSANGRTTVTIPRAAILPEKWFADTGNAAKGVGIRLMSGTNRWEGTINIGQPGGQTPYTYAMPRNTYINVTVTAGDDIIYFNALEIPDWGSETIAATGAKAVYNVECAPATAKGTSMTNLPRTEAGMPVTIMAIPYADPNTPGAKYSFTGWEVKHKGTTTVVPYAVDANQPLMATFTMPACDVTVTPRFGNANLKQVTVVQTAGITATASTYWAEPGQTVTLTAVPDDADTGSLFRGWTVTAASGSTVTTTESTGNSFAAAFTMANENVTVTLNVIRKVINEGLVDADMTSPQNRLADFTATAGGVDLPGDEEMVLPGATVTLTPAASWGNGLNKADYVFIGWELTRPDGTPASLPGVNWQVENLTFEMPDFNVTARGRYYKRRVVGIYKYMVGSTTDNVTDYHDMNSASFDARYRNIGVRQGTPLGYTFDIADKHVFKEFEIKDNDTGGAPDIPNYSVQYNEAQRKATITFDMPAANISIRAITEPFRDVTPVARVDNTNNAPVGTYWFGFSTTPEVHIVDGNTASVPNGTTLTITAPDIAGYDFTRWETNTGVPLTTSSTLTLTVTDNNNTPKAIYTPKPYGLTIGSVWDDDNRTIATGVLLSYHMSSTAAFNKEITVDARLSTRLVQSEWEWVGWEMRNTDDELIDLSSARMETQDIREWDSTVQAYKDYKVYKLKFNMPACDVTINAYFRRK